MEPRGGIVTPTRGAGQVQREGRGFDHIWFRRAARQGRSPAPSLSPIRESQRARYHSGASVFDDTDGDDEGYDTQQEDTLLFDMDGGYDEMMTDEDEEEEMEEGEVRSRSDRRLTVTVLPRFCTCELPYLYAGEPDRVLKTTHHLSLAHEGEEVLFYDQSQERRRYYVAAILDEGAMKRLGEDGGTHYCSVGYLSKLMCKHTRVHLC